MEIARIYQINNRRMVVEIEEPKQFYHIIKDKGLKCISNKEELKKYDKPIDLTEDVYEEAFKLIETQLGLYFATIKDNDQFNVDYFDEHFFDLGSLRVINCVNLIDYGLIIEEEVIEVDNS